LSVKIFKSGRAGLDVARTTADTAMTRALMFDEAFAQQDVQTIRPVTLRASYNGYLSAAAGTETNSFEMSGTLTYDHAIWLANTHIKAVAAGVKGVGIDYLWTFLPTAASDDIKSASIQLGYSDGLAATQPAVHLKNCLGDELSISWDKSGDGAVTYTSRMVTPNPAVQLTAFGGAADATGAGHQVVSSSTTAITVDASTIGSTADVYWQNLTWTLNNGFTNLYTLNNTTAATATFRPKPRNWKLEGSRYYGPTASAVTEWNAYIAKTPRKIRIKSTGATIGSSVNTVELDLYGVYTGMQWDEKDDLGFQTFTLEPIYDATATADFILKITSGLTAIT
jgi:hypothetical protein